MVHWKLVEWVRHESCIRYFWWHPKQNVIMGQIMSSTAPHNTSSELCTNNTHPTFQQTPDLTEMFLSNLVGKWMVDSQDVGIPYFGWNGLVFQCGGCHNSVPTNVNFISCFSHLVNVYDQQKMEPPELLPGTMMQSSQKLVMNSRTSNDQRNQPFTLPPTEVDSSSDQKMVEYSPRHHWLNMLHGLTTPIDGDNV